MKDLLKLLLHLLTTIAKLIRPGDTKAVVADSLLMKQQGRGRRNQGQDDPDHRFRGEN